MAQTAAQLANLENGKATQFTGENAAIYGAKGGKAGAESKRARKTLRAELEELLAMHARDPKTGKESEKTFQEAITLALVKKALKGDAKAYELIRDTIGEKPTEKIALAEIDQSTIDEVEKMVMARDA